jgi:hypothetical protein
VAAVLDGVHRWPTARALGRSDAVFRSATALAGAIPVYDAPDPLSSAPPSARLRTIIASFDALL